MQINVNLGKDGSLIFKEKAAKAIEQTFELSSLPRVECDNKRSKIQEITKKHLKSCIHSSLRQTCPGTYINKVSCGSNEGKLLVRLHFSNGFEVSLINTYQNTNQTNERLSKKELKKEKKRLEERGMNLLVPNSHMSKTEKGLLKPNIDELRCSLTQRFIEIGRACLQHRRELPVNSINHKTARIFLSSDNDCNVYSHDAFRNLALPSQFQGYSRSKTNQAKESLNVDFLQNAQPTGIKTDLTEAEITILENATESPQYFSNPYDLPDALSRLTFWLVDARHTQSVRFLNHVIRNGILPPLELMSIMIKKYGAPRLGDLRDADAIYDKITEAYLANSDCSEESKYTFLSNYMQIYLTRYQKNDETLDVRNKEKHLISFFNAHKNIETFNILVKMYMDSRCYDEARNLLERECPIHFNEWTHHFILQYYYYTEGFASALAYFNQHKHLESNSMFCFMLQIAGDRITPAIQEHFNQICAERNTPIPQSSTARSQYYFDHVLTPSMRQNEKNQRKLMQIYINHNEPLEAWSVFANIETPLQPTFGIMIEMLFHHGMYYYARILLKKAEERGFFSEAAPVYGSPISINFHSYYVNGSGTGKGGTPQYNSFNKQQITVMLQKFYVELYQLYNSGKIALPATINFICGKGKEGKLINMVQNLLSEQFKIDATLDDKNPGQLVFTLDEYHAKGMLCNISSWHEANNALTQELESRITAYLSTNIPEAASDSAQSSDWEDEQIFVLDQDAEEDNRLIELTEISGLESWELLLDDTQK